MNSDFLIPIKDSDLLQSLLSSSQSLGNTLKIYTEQNDFPDVSNVKIAIFGVEEGRKSEDNLGCGEDLHHIRRQLYSLYCGNWHTEIADLGTIKKGNTVEDTYFAVEKTITSLLKQGIIPIIIGGGQDITFANYKAYDTLEQSVNITSIDSRFDLGTLEDELTSKTYLSKIIMQQPNNLFNYSNIGYQTYFNSQEEINLLEHLFFDIYRLGEIKNIEVIEPVLRDSDIVSVDIGAIRYSDAPGNKNVSPNGFYGEDACTIARYAGISDKVSSFGIYEYNSKYDTNDVTAHLIAQMIWYFIEGVNNRAKDYPFSTKDTFQKFTVLFENDDPINFFKSDKTGRWWMEVNIVSNNKYRRHALIPCTYQDYLDALAQIIPERWYKGMKKMV